MVKKKKTRKTEIRKASRNTYLNDIKKQSRNFLIHFDLKVLGNHVEANIKIKQQEEKNQIIESVNF